MPILKPSWYFISLSYCWLARLIAIQPTMAKKGSAEISQNLRSCCAHLEDIARMWATRLPVVHWLCFLNSDLQAAVLASDLL